MKLTILTRNILPALILVIVMSILALPVEAENENLYKWQMKDYGNLQWDYLQNKRRNVDDIIKERERLQNLEQQLINEQHMYKNSIRQHGRDIESQKSALRKEVDRLKALNESILKLQTTFNNKQAALEQLLDKISIKEEDKKDLEEKLLDQEKEIQAVQKQHAEALASLNALRDEYTHRQEQIWQMGIMFADRSNDKEELLQQHSTLEKEIVKLEKQNQEIASNNEKLKKNFLKRQTEFNTLRGSIIQQGLKKAALDEKYHSQEKDLAEMANKSKDMLASYTVLKEEYMRIQEQLWQVGNLYTARQEEQTILIREYDQKIAELKKIEDQSLEIVRINQELRDQYQLRQKEIEEYRLSFGDQEKEKTTLKSQLESQKDELRKLAAKTRGIQESNKRLKDNYKKSQKEFLALKKSIYNQDQEKIALHKRLKYQRDEIQILITRIDGLKDSNKDLYSEFDYLKNEYIFLERNYAKQTIKNKNIKSTLNEEETALMKKLKKMSGVKKASATLKKRFRREQAGLWQLEELYNKQEALKDQIKTKLNENNIPE
ncbi:MAG: hypothetical protein K8S27_07965 [Candidatus Omnitrophica bacterium]|nr:hypothetical protein [Candidatus Omnitrophota bacterium]